MFKADLRMRCDPCKIRFLKLPWFIGHLVRCSRWKENGKDVIDYFSDVSKKKLVIMRRPKKKEEKKPPTCFSCFCGKSFLSPTLHSAHLQQCLSKAMSMKPSISVARVKTTKEPTPKLDYQEDESVTIQLIPKSQDEIHSIEPEDSILKSSEVQKEVHDTERVDVTQQDQVIVLVKPSAREKVPTVPMSHEESLLLQREIMHEDSLEGQVLDDTVMQLEHFEDEQRDDPHVANEVEVGTYEEVSSCKETVQEQRTLPRTIPPRKSEKTLVIETDVCDCGKKCRNAEELTNHLKFCSYYFDSPQKRVVLITCACRSQFTKVDIKEHLLSCEAWKYVKKKKNLDKTPTNLEAASPNKEFFGEAESTENVDRHKTEIPEESSHVECYEQEVITQSIEVVEKPESSLVTQDNQTVKDVSVSNKASEGNAAQATPQVICSGTEQPTTTFAVEFPEVTYKCECDAVFRRANVYHIHQTGCKKYLATRGKVAEDTEDKSSLDQSFKKQDVVLKYSGPLRGEVLKKCACGFALDSIISYRQHIAKCPSFKTALSPKIHVPASPKRPPLISETKRSAKHDSDEESHTARGSIKKSKVELRDELKDFVKLPDPEKQDGSQTRKKK